MALRQSPFLLQSRYHIFLGLRIRSPIAILEAFAQLTPDRSRHWQVESVRSIHRPFLSCLAIISPRLHSSLSDHHTDDIRKDDDQSLRRPT
jgi:hypothetical protein